MNRLCTRKMYTYAMEAIKPTYVSNSYNAMSKQNILISIDDVSKKVTIEHDIVNLYENQLVLPKIKKVLQKMYPTYYHYVLW